MADQIISQEYLREIFDYKDGQLIWKLPRSKIQVGQKTGHLNFHGYLNTKLDGKNYRTHRLIFMWHYGYLPKQIDHINGIKDDNRIENLREVSDSENSYNQNLKSNNKDAAYLLTLVKHTDNMRLLFLSATPMFNDAKEIVWLLNLMRVNDRRPKIYIKDIFDSDNNLLVINGKEVGKQRLQEASIGYVSFVKGENPYTFPYRVFPSMFSKSHALDRKQVEESRTHGTVPYPKFTFDGKSTVPGLEYVDVYITKLKKHQNEIYIKKIEELKNRRINRSNY